MWLLPPFPASPLLQPATHSSPTHPSPPSSHPPSPSAHLSVMSTRCEVHHLNITVGDCILLIVRDQSAKPPGGVQFAALLDGGNVLNMCYDILLYVDWHLRGSKHALDAIINTHFDADHLRGFIGMLRALELSYDTTGKLIKKSGYNKTTINPGAPALAKQYITPATRVYDQGASQLQDKSKGVKGDKTPLFVEWRKQLRALHEDKRLIARMDGSEGIAAPYTTANPYSLLGRCLFRDDAKQGPPVFNSATNSYVNDVSSLSKLVQLRHGSAKQPSHYLFCVAINRLVIGQTTQVLADAVARSEVNGGNGAAADSASASATTSAAQQHGDIVMVVQDDAVTNTNQLSIGLLLVSVTTAADYQIQHYLVGDMGQRIEQKVLEWLKASALPSSIPFPVPVVRLSHHGSSFSTPALSTTRTNMYDVLRPDNVFIGVAEGKHHETPTWAVLMAYLFASEHASATTAWSTARMLTFDPFPYWLVVEANPDVKAQPKSPWVWKYINTYGPSARKFEGISTASFTEVMEALDAAVKAVDAAGKGKKATGFPLCRDALKHYAAWKTKYSNTEYHKKNDSWQWKQNKSVDEDIQKDAQKVMLDTAGAIACLHAFRGTASTKPQPDVQGQLKAAVVQDTISAFCFASSSDGKTEPTAAYLIGLPSPATPPPPQTLAWTLIAKKKAVKSKLMLSDTAATHVVRTIAISRSSNDPPSPLAFCTIAQLAELALQEARLFDQLDQLHSDIDEFNLNEDGNRQLASDDDAQMELTKRPDPNDSVTLDSEHVVVRRSERLAAIAHAQRNKRKRDDAATALAATLSQSSHSAATIEVSLTSDLALLLCPNPPAALPADVYLIHSDTQPALARWIASLPYDASSGDAAYPHLVVSALTGPTVSDSDWSISGTLRWDAMVQWLQMALPFAQSSDEDASTAAAVALPQSMPTVQLTFQWDVVLGSGNRIDAKGDSVPTFTASVTLNSDRPPMLSASAASSTDTLTFTGAVDEDDPFTLWLELSTSPTASVTLGDVVSLLLPNSAGAALEALLDLTDLLATPLPLSADYSRLCISPARQSRIEWQLAVQLASLAKSVQLPACLVSALTGSEAKLALSKTVMMDPTGAVSYDCGVALIVPFADQQKSGAQGSAELRVDFGSALSSSRVTLLVWPHQAAAAAAMETQHPILTFLQSTTSDSSFSFQDLITPLSELGFVVDLTQAVQVVELVVDFSSGAAPTHISLFRVALRVTLPGPSDGAIAIDVDYTYTPGHQRLSGMLEVDQPPTLKQLLNDSALFAPIANSSIAALQFSLDIATGSQQKPTKGDVSYALSWQHTARQQYSFPAVQQQRAVHRSLSCIAVGGFVWPAVLRLYCAGTDHVRRRPSDSPHHRAVREQRERCCCCRLFTFSTRQSDSAAVLRCRCHFAVRLVFRFHFHFELVHRCGAVAPVHLAPRPAAGREADERCERGADERRDALRHGGRPQQGPVEVQLHSRRHTAHSSQLRHASGDRGQPCAQRYCTHADSRG